MPSFDRVVIALALGDEDDTTLSVAGQLLPLIQPEQVDVVHVVDTRLLPDAVVEAYPGLLKGSRRRRLRRLEEQLEASFLVPDGTPVRTHIRVGAPLYEILDLSLRFEASLIITGRSSRGRRVETLPVRLARKAPCPVLAVPEDSRLRLQRILVSLDFSDHSAHALDVAVALAQRALARRLRGIHAYALPPGVKDSGKSEEEFAELMRAYAVRGFERFQSGRPELPLPFEMEYVLHRDPAQAIIDAADPSLTDLVVVGARGDTVSGPALLGSVAARLVHACPVPVLVTRRRKASQRTLKTVMELLGERT